MTKSSTSARRRSSPDPELVPEAVPEALEDGFNDSCFPEGVGKRLPLSLAGGVEKLSRGGWPLASANEGDEGEGDEVLVHDSVRGDVDEFMVAALGTSAESDYRSVFGV